MEKGFYSNEELKTLGIKKYGRNVLISKNAMIYHPDLLEIGDNVRIDDFCTLSGKIVLGSYIHIAQFCGIYGGTKGVYMMDFSGLSSKTTVYATSNDYSGESLTNPMVPQKYKPTDKNEKVVIGKHVVVGCMSVILPGVEIVDGSAIGTMSLCNKSITDPGIYVGVPAKKVKERKKNIFLLEEQLRKDTAQEN